MSTIITLPDEFELSTPEDTAVRFFSVQNTPYKTDREVWITVNSVQL